MTIEAMAIEKRLRELAKLAVDVLDLQKRYFKTREREHLIASKSKESELRRTAEQILQQEPGT